MKKAFTTAAAAAAEEKDAFAEKERARLFMALCSVYGQASDDSVVALAGPKHDMPMIWKKLLDRKELEYESVHAYMVQGTVEEWPEASLKEELGAEEFRKLEMIAAYVRVSWILAHMLCPPTGSPDYRAKFEEAVELSRRMAKTLRLVAEGIAARAWELAEALRLTEQVKALDEEAQAKFTMDTPIELQVFEPKLPYEFNSLLSEKKEALLSSDEERHHAFFWTVSHVFSYQLTQSSRHVLRPSEVAIIPNGTRQPYWSMSAEEKERSGSISLKEIMDALLVDGKEEAAILGALKASRGFAQIAQTLSFAVDKCFI